MISSKLCPPGTMFLNQSDFVKASMAAKLNQSDFVKASMAAKAADFHYDLVTSLTDDEDLTLKTTEAAMLSAASELLPEAYRR